MPLSSPAQGTRAAASFGPLEITLVFFVAVAWPTLLAYNVSPSATLLNQLLSVMGWGLVLAFGFTTASDGASTSASLAGSARPVVGAPWAGTGSLCAALAGIGVLMVASWAGGPLPTSLALPAVLLVVIALGVIVHGARAGAADRQVGAQDADLRPGRAFAPFAWAMLAAGLLGSVIALMQVFTPDWTDGDFIAHSSLPGRAVGNLRQPNHLSSLLVWALIALVPLVEAQRLRRTVGAALGALLVFGVVLTASRTGLVGIGLLALWGLLDRQLSRQARGGLLAAPLAYGVGWLAMAAWAHIVHETFGGEARLAETDLSSSRFGIWSNTLKMIRDQPWTGVGFGEFNFAWTLSPFPHRPTAFFDHTHNLLLQFAVEFGLPLAALLLALLLWAVWRAFQRAFGLPAQTRSPDAPGAGASARAAVMMVLLIGLHSLLEYPLWYAYFLLPAVWAWGYALHSPTAPAALPATRTTGVLLRVGGVAMMVGALFAAWDYTKVVVIFSPGDNAPPLDQRIARGQGSLLFAHHADYAAVTIDLPAPPPPQAFKRTVQALLDTRLMIAWAQSFAAAGDTERARFLAARLREFHHEESKDFFAPCDAPAGMAEAASAASAASAKPFQCEASRGEANGSAGAPLGWRDFR